MDPKHNPPDTKDTGRVQNNIHGTADQHKNTDQLENELMTSVKTEQEKNPNQKTSLNEIDTTTSTDDKCKEQVISEKKHLSLLEKIALLENTASLTPKKVLLNQTNPTSNNMGDADLKKTSDDVSGNDVNLPKTTNEQEAYGIT